MPARRWTRSTTASTSRVSREAEREGKVQDIIDLVKSLMSEDADGNEEQAKMALLEAHSSAREARHWGDIAKCWAHLFLDFERAESCYDRALDIASAGPSVPTVDYRIKEADEHGGVTRHVIGHSMVPTGVYLTSLSAVIFGAVSDFGKQLRMMSKAEEEARNVRSLLHAFEEFDEEALRYFDKVESQSGWLHIARCWMEGLENLQQARRCLARAEELADEMSNIPNWVAVAKFWMRVMGEPGEAQRCVAEAERLIEKHTAREYIMLAEGLAVMGDPEVTVQYLDKAESLIEELSDWSDIAYTWEELGYFDRAERANYIWEYLGSKVYEGQYLANCGGTEMEVEESWADRPPFPLWPTLGRSLCWPPLGIVGPAGKSEMDEREFRMLNLSI